MNLIKISKEKFKIKMQELIEEFENSNRFPHIDREMLKAQYADLDIGMDENTLFEVDEIMVNNQKYSNLHVQSGIRKDDDAMRELVRLVLKINIKLKEYISMDLTTFKEEDTELSPVVFREIATIKLYYTENAKKRETVVKLNEKMDNLIAVLVEKSKDEKFPFLNFIKESVDKKNNQRIDSEELILEDCVRMVFINGRKSLKPLFRRTKREIEAFMESKNGKK